MMVMVMVGEGVGFQDLPEGCIANVVSLTTPRDACSLALVSSTFRSAAESDSVWDRFLPSDYNDIVSQSTSSSCRSKKQLYLSLCENPILVDDGKKSFQLDKAYGKKCYMLSPRMLSIVWGDTPRYWKWTPLPEARFSEVAELVSVCWLEIRGWINTHMLSPDTLYGAYLVFKPSSAGAYGFEYQSIEVSIAVAGGETHKRTVFLDPERGKRLRYQIVPRRVGIFNRTRMVAAAGPPQPPRDNLDDQYPKDRKDGWLEMELGQFFSEGGEDKEVEMGVYEIKGGDWKGGLLVQGIEVRPKQCVHANNTI
ncbi:hypothetical protein HN51_028311 [Arachis hypogaea]|uniref:F-box protein PP2-B12 n=2 Tax=Arachis TaxID=3817 RepID=A0A6P4BI84_ARADU|nr:putative F-box protein PP2-B12 [Arachis duranensis]XP_025619340.1 putative F-box protein PP2-B12 [Arachis hypogaea]XP_052110761.1 putative F-box protein PP2-B12 [Arachis duranensis]QHO34800.1 Putative F-box protein [Arachis hypogaea]RYR38779.1 hypothetical protein Ahy_A09g043959 isoform A [Arachis hypogaea]RYR38780.1 hypothetical protein Ahy_A09g043959 isoform B [Arachis hypogaea]